MSLPPVRCRPLDHGRQPRRRRRRPLPSGVLAGAALAARLVRSWLVLALVAACAAGGAAPPGGEGGSAEAIVADRIVFGRVIPGGGSVTDADWEAFLREVVTPRFPDGLTVWRAEGQWTDPRGELVREPVVVVEIFHPAGAGADSAIASIAEEYRRRFRQDAVLRVTTEARIRFLD